MNNYRTIQQKAMQLLFPAWEQNIPSLGTKHSQPGNKTGRKLVVNNITAHPSRAYGSCLASLRLVVALLLMLVLGVNIAWAQETDYSGTYYIKSKSPKQNTPGDYYLCPTEGWAFYKATNDVQGDDNGQPFLTTYQCRDGSYDATKAIWIVEKERNSGCYYIKQAKTVDGKYKYMVSNGVLTGAGNTRARVHLETVANAAALADLGDWALFEITYDNTNATYPDHYDILPHSTYGRAGDNIYLTVNTNNYNNLDGTNAKTNGPTGFKNCGGIIGLYTHPDDGNTCFYLEETPVRPTITNNFDGTFTITAASGATIYYTTDGTPPSTETTTTGTTSVTFNQTENVTVIKAIAKGEGDFSPSKVATYDLPRCERPVITVSDGNVTIICATEGAAIHYTTNGDPATSLSTEYTTSFAKGDATTIRAIATKVGYVNSSEAALLPPKEVSSSSEITDMSGNYMLASNFSSSGSIGTSDNPFKGIIDGNLNPLTLSYPLVGFAEDATIKNVILDNVTISGGINAGAICCEAKGDTRIYNCGVLASNSTVEKDADGYDKITSCSSSISGSGYVGSIVGLLDDGSRVINCFSYANVSGGSYVGGIVGYNNVITTATNLRTMVMNCMFYGEVSGSSIAPIYNGEIITNVGDNTGVSNFNYFRLEASYIQNTAITKVFNCALGAETRFLQRFEFYRHLLNSNRELAAWWATGNAANKDDMMKWVMEPSQIGSTTPYPILKTAGKYASVVNYTPSETTYNEADRNKGRKFGTLAVTIQLGSGGATDASLTTTSLDLTITDKDFEHFNYNYGKVQLPYYNDVGTKNYTNDKVVTGWKIVNITGGTAGSYSTGEDVTYNASGELTTTPYNFADRKCTNKDLYGTGGSNRVFNQGAYWDVPEGVTAITIEPYWGKAVYLADAYYDVVYNTDMTTSYNVTTVGGGQHYDNGVSTFNGQKVYTTMANAVSALNPSGTVYDNAVVLVGNYHEYSGKEQNLRSGKPYTVTSIDLDGDNEPDYSFMWRFDGRTKLHPVRYDFLNLIGLGMAQKSTGGTGSYNFGIPQPLDWFEVTNTALFRVTQFEYSPANRVKKPIILQGGVIEQWVTLQNDPGDRVEYFHVGGNVWFKEFHRGSHQDNKNLATPHPPVSVTGGDYSYFYLTGLYQSQAAIYDDNAECYINGGRFGEVAGVGMEGIGTSDGKGNITWVIDHADIKEFYGGGINFAKPAHGNIHTIISNSHVDQFCGGPKFGDMESGRTVITTATGCTFGTYFGAGFGGNSYNRYAPANRNNVINLPGPGKVNNQQKDLNSWNDWVNDEYTRSYNSTYSGVSTQIDYQFIPMSTNVENVARLFVEFVSFSLATTHNVTSSLTDCTIIGNFYGGGSLGKVEGDVTSTLTNCTVNGSVFGAGYSASLPPVEVMNTGGFLTEPYYYTDLGTYRTAVPPATTTYTWVHVTDAEFSSKKVDNDNHILYTTADLSALGKVTGKATLYIEGTTTTVAGSVYGGGEESNVEGNTQVNITGGTISDNVFGGGKGEADEFSCSKAMVGVNNAGAGADLTTEENKNKGTKVTISNGTVNGNVYGGGEVGRVEWNTQVTIGAVSGGGTPIVNGSVFGAGAGVATHGYAALVRGNSSVTIQGNAKVIENVYGGGEQATVGRYWVKGINNVDSEGNPIPSAPSAPTDMPDEMPYKTMSGGQCTVTVQGSAQIGPDDGATATAGHVFGAGKGVTPHYVHTGDKANWSKRMVDYNSEKHTGEPGTTWDYYADDHNYVWEYFATEDKYFEFLQTLALVTGTDVTIGGGTVKGNVYGGSESGFVQDDTDVKVTSGTIGTSGTTTNGNVFGGGKGLLAFAEAGKVKGTTKVAINNGAIKGNVYGGGELGDVGLITKPADYNYTWKQSDGNTDNTGGNNVITGTNNNTGICTVTISGGTIGISESVSSEHGNVFGAGKGAGTTFWCEKAIAFATNVSVNGGTVHGNVYGGGQIGRVEDDAKVTIGGASAESGADIKGSVFGAGAGLATHGYSALVRGDTKVTIDGYAKVAKSVYGGGETASVGRYGLNAQKMPNILVGGGKCELKVQGNATIGEDVFGACKGVTPAYNNTQGDDNRSKRMVTYDPDREVNAHKETNKDTFWNYYDDDHRFVWEYFTTSEAYSQYLETLALATHPEVTIDGSATVGGSVYGGGELGLTKGSVIVNIQGGTIEEDVYGGGALADTNTTELVADNYPTTSPTLNEDGSIKTKQVHPTTTVNLTGGLIKGDAYGGGLGSADAPAYVHGDVLVDLNGTTTKDANTGKPTTTGTPLSNSDNGCVVSQIFGCNNVNGSPKGNVMVHIYATQNKQTTTIGQKFIREIDSDTAKGENETDPAYVTRLKGILTGKIAFAEALNITVSDEVKALCMAESPAVTDLKTAITSVTTSINVKTTDEINGVRYDVTAVYGGGNMAAYVPDSPFDGTDGSKTQVIIDGCDKTSIQTVYGGGNAAAVPETNVTINAAYEIGYVFGGGNGKDDIAPGVTNPGADVGQYNNGTETVTYGTGNANSTLIGGLIHEAYGGSNTRGVIKGSLNQTTDPGYPEDPNCCELIMDKVVGAGKYADIDGDVNMTLSCQPNRKINELFAGADEANVNGNITLNITNGHFGKVFGGNNLGGAVKGKITVNVEETECQPIKIDNLYLGGNQAAYSVYGYYESEDIHPVTGKKILKPRVSANDSHTAVPNPATDATHTFPYAQPELNIISCTYIGNVFGGGLGKEAKMYANPTVNVNMVPGAAHAATAVPAMMAELELDVSKTAANPDNLGIIRNIYGGGDAADIEGNTTVNIAVEYVVKQVFVGDNVAGYYTRSGAGTTADPFVYTAATGTALEGKTYYEKKAAQGSAYIIGSVFGGGNAADVLGNTNVTMSGGYVFNGIFGGGYAGNVGTFTRSSALEHTEVYGHTAHASKCIGKPISCKEGTGKCTVLVNGGQIGPISVATEGMNRPEAQGGPVPQGWVWGAGQGLIEDPAKEPDTHFKSYVGSTDVTIGGTAFVLESIIGGGEFGRVLGNTKVTITGNCQIGVGAGTDMVDANGKPVRYTEAQWTTAETAVSAGNASSINTIAAAMPACSHFPYGRNTGTEQAPNWVYDTYDPYADEYKTAKGSYNYPGGSTDHASDGKTWIGCVFGGGSGYFPYKTTDTNGDITNYDWLSSAGWVEGNTEVRISGGHILTNVYGGNEYTNVKGKCKITMSGGTIGVPRTLDQIKTNPMIGNIFGAGKGDPRVHFNKTTNVGEVEIEVTGGIIYGSVFGGGEDGHVLKDVSLTIGTDSHTGPTIGTWGTSYFEGNVFGGGRGFSGDAYTAGNVAGSVTLNIKGGSILGSVFGGGRLGSVGYGLFDKGETGYGEMRADTDTEAGFNTSGDFTNGRGHIDITISGGTIGNKYEYDYIAPNVTGNALTAAKANMPNTEHDAKNILTHTKGGNVFAGGMGRMYQLDGTTPISDVDWWKLGSVKSTKLTISGDAKIKSNVYGGGEMGLVVGKQKGGSVGTEVIINGGTIGTEIKDGEAVKYTFGSVFGGGYGSLVEKLTHTSKDSYPKYIAGRVKGGTKVNMTGGAVLASVYGGGEMAAVGESTLLSAQTDPKIYGETLTGAGGVPLEANTHVIISGGTIGKDKVVSGENVTYFGGAKMGNVYGGGSGHNNTVRSGHVYGNTNVTINAGSNGEPKIYHNVYGGGAYGSVGEFVYETTMVSGAPKVSGITGLSTDHTNTGVATVTINGGTIGVDGRENGMVFGSSRGDINKPGERDDHTAWVYKTYVTIGSTSTGPDIKGSVYGSGENGHVFNDTEVAIHGGTIGVHDGSAADATRGNVYGGGCGEDTYKDGAEDKYNPLSGIVYGSTKVTMDGGSVLHNIYGAGALGSVGKYDANGVITSGGKTTIEISGGRVGYDGNDNGNVYGAARGDVDATQTGISQVKETEVKIKYSTTPTGDNEGKTEKLVAGSVFGGGQAGIVQGSVVVNMTGGLILKDIYGGGALADTQTSNWDATSNTWATGMVTNGKTTYKTTVNLLGGTIGGDAYGGGLGQKKDFNGGTSDIEATVYGDITVNLGDEGATKATAFNISYDDTDDRDESNNFIQVVGSGRVFGCNNLNGSPQGDVTVNVYKTVTGNVGRTDAENSTAPAQEQRASRDANVPHTYELAAVYGGGNLADYTATGKKASVTIHTCDVSVQHVYGGGNAAAVPETDVLVKGAWEIDHVFGGGNGKDKFKNGNQWILNEGANVSGNTNTLLIGGYIHEAYGGSNEKGTIGGNVTINTNSEHEDCACDLELVKLYGAGKNADIEGDLIVVLGCAPETKTEEVYGGAENANVRGNVELTITSGTFGKVFGGNNQSGAIFGHIILNIEETGCRPINIDELYGCGNNAAYSVYGYKNGGTDYEGYPIYVPRTSNNDGTAVTFDGKPHTNPGDQGYADPEVNIISCTRIGQVFGGGLGSGATVYGNPTVNIDQIYGKAYRTVDNELVYDATATTLGEIGDVFGGGNKANVVGNTNVNIGTKKEVWLHQSVDANGNYTMDPANTGSGNGIPVVGANITGNVYGGGNEAEVTGDTNVNIGKKSE